MLVRNIDLIRESLNPELRVSMILLTMYDKRTKLSTEVADEVRSHFPNLVLESTIPARCASPRRPATARPSSPMTLREPVRCPTSRPRPRSPIAALCPRRPLTTD